MQSIATSNKIWMVIAVGADLCLPIQENTARRLEFQTYHSIIHSIAYINQIGCQRERYKCAYYV